MADISKIKATNGTTYNIKDSTARTGLETKITNPTGGTEGNVLAMGASAPEWKELGAGDISAAPTNHAVNASTYGLGTTSVYGHVKTVNNLTTSAHANGLALSAYQGKVLKDAVDGKAPKSHASTASTYGLGTTDNYGHVKTVNDLTTSAHADGLALSAYQGKVLKDDINSNAFYIARLTEDVNTNTGEISELKAADEEMNRKINGKADANHTHSYLPLSGGTVTGGIEYKDSRIDLKESDNGTTADLWPTPLRFLDKNNYSFGGLRMTAFKSGPTRASLVVFNRKSDNTQVEGAFGIQIDKSGNVSYAISNSNALKSAIGLSKVDNLDYLPLSGGTMTGNITMGAHLLRSDDTLQLLGANYLNLRSSHIQCRNNSDNAWSGISASAFNKQSSERYKENIKLATDDIANLVYSLKVKRYDYKDHVVDDDHRYDCVGLIAEELNESIPNAVNRIKDDDGNMIPDGIDYSALVPYLLKTIQVQHEDILVLYEAINELASIVSEE